MPSTPSSRLILSDLILQLSELSKNNTSSSAPPTPPSRFNTSDEPAPNPLKALPKEVQQIVVALEYLIPCGVTTALDVLDKGLVTRYTLKPEDKAKEEGQEGQEKEKEKAEENVEEEAEEKIEVPAAEREIPGSPTGSGSEISDIREEEETATAAEIVESNDSSTPARTEKYSYYVESEKIPRSRFSKKPAYPSSTYHVLLDAWYCTCPKFFDSLATKPKPVATSAYPELTDKNKRARRRWEKKEFERVWDLLKTHNWVWGGRMMGVHAPPICKHLLACVLAENCGNLFMPFVKRVEVDLDEMVGLSVNILRVG